MSLNHWMNLKNELKGMNLFDLKRYLRQTSELHLAQKGKIL